MKLMYGPISPFARKVRAAAIELGLDRRIELQLTEVGPGKQNHAYATNVNPLRKIPALITDDGVALVDSTVICEYLDALAGGGKIIPAAGAQRWRVLLRNSIAQGMCEAIVLVRYETSLRPEALRWSVWTEDQWDRVFAGLAWFEQRASALDEFVDVSQLALACCLGYVDFRFSGTDWQSRFPQVAAWYRRIASRPSLARTAPQNPV